MINPVSSVPTLANTRPEQSATSKNPGERSANDSGIRMDAPPQTTRPDASDGADKTSAASKPTGCETCKNRKYQDVSSDPGVSFKSPTSVAPEAARAAVANHEGQHVSRERAKAATEEREIVYQNVQYFTAVCPECGKVYTSGGLTTTASRSKPKTPEKGIGESVDAYA